MDHLKEKCVVIDFLEILFVILRLGYGDKDILFHQLVYCLGVHFVINSLATDNEGGGVPVEIGLFFLS